jgi:hypothetical protein
LPYLKAWDAKYRSKGLTIVGVHSPEFPFEKSADNVKQAIAENGIHYPVAQDNNLDTWNAYGNQYWPAEYLIDSRGRVRFTAFGEGDDVSREQAIRSLLAERGATSLGYLSQPNAQLASDSLATPESYLGAARAERFANGTLRTGTQDFGSPSGRALDLSELRYSGRWAITDESATAGANAGLDLRFQARRVFLVMGSPGGPRRVRVFLNGRPVRVKEAGMDVSGGAVEVGFQRLYRLIDLPRVETATLSLRPDPGLTAYAFTFG